MDEWHGGWWVQTDGYLSESRPEGARPARLKLGGGHKSAGEQTPPAGWSRQGSGIEPVAGPEQTRH